MFKLRVFELGVFELGVFELGVLELSHVFEPNVVPGARRGGKNGS